MSEMPPAAPVGRPRRRRTRVWWIAFLGIVSVVTICAAVGVGAFLGILGELPAIEELEYYDPPQVSQLYDRTGSMAIGEFRNKDLRRQVVPLDEIPLDLRNAFIAIEDSRFLEHFGVDIIGVVRAMRTNLRAGAIVEGASTLTMQLTRNILPDVGTEKTLERKIKEAILAFQIERRYSKAQILEFYLNHIALGPTDFGVSAAANAYFLKSLDQLTLAECATIAGIPKATTVYNPRFNPKRSQARRDIILRRMHMLGMISDERLEQALAEPLVTNPGQSSLSRYPYFVAQVRTDLLGHHGLSSDLLINGGLRITTTIDPAIQEACDKAMREGLVRAEKQWQAAKPRRQTQEREKWNGQLRAGEIRLMRIEKLTSDTVSVRLNQWNTSFKLPAELPYYDPSVVLKQGALLDVFVEEVTDAGAGEFRGRLGDTIPIQGSIVVLNAHTAEVLALVGGANFYNERWHGHFNRATMGGRQVGSCIKPLFFAAAFERGFGPDQVIVDEAVEYGVPGGYYRPINYEKRFFGPQTLIEAMEHSRNVVTLRLYESLGMNQMLDVVRRFDFTERQPQWELRRELSQPLGTIDVSPLELAAAYQAIANLGVAIRPQLVRAIADAQGNQVLRPKREEQAILDPIAAYQTQYILRQVVLGGTGQREIGSRFKSPPYPPVVGKTGTTNLCVDGWFAGFTPDLVIVVQVGFDNPRPMGPEMTGGRLAGPIWAEAFDGILKTRPNWSMSFETPPGIRVANICARHGNRAGSCGSPVYYNVPFKAGQEPTKPCDGRVRTPLVRPVTGQWSYLGGQRSGIARASSEGPSYQNHDPGAYGDAPEVPAGSGGGSTYF